MFIPGAPGWNLLCVEAQSPGAGAEFYSTAWAYVHSAVSAGMSISGELETGNEGLGIQGLVVLTGFTDMRHARP